MSKVILITGASSGIGKDAAIQLIKEGHKVYTAARRIEKMKELQEMGGFPMQMDVAKNEDVKNVVDQILQKDGKIDVLWNNAGYGLYGSVENISIAAAKKQFEVNLFGLANLTQKVLPYMRKAKSGTIINTSSMGGKMYTPLGAWYHATKHAVEGFSDCLRLETKQFNINVVVLEPGAIATEFGDVLTQPMLDNCKNTAYEPMAKLVAKTVNDSYHKPNGASPRSVITNIISKIVRSKKPKTRYRAGKWAKPMVWMRLYLGDRIFDKVIMNEVK
ncbi:oxidoreductase [Tenacibaculum sp. nBUS_03]|uniref:oxidoreductase n=1 Tax=Tenacibaculum sp. nBUS_03 TaxID=3395320 RepID=UPI003EBD75F0